MSDPIEFLSRRGKHPRLVAFRPPNGLLVVGLLAVFVFAGCSAGVGPTPSQAATYAPTSTPTPATSTTTATSATTTATPAPTSTPGPAGFSATGSMPHVRAAHTGTLLSDGRVLIVGGGTDTTMLVSAELYDPATGKFSQTGSMARPRIGHTATLLRDGRVLVAGGQDNLTAPLTYLASAELYDPATGKFSPTGSMALPRYGATATLLLDGRVLIAGSLLFKEKLPLKGNLEGYSAELYDPATGKFTMTGSMAVDRENHTATLLPDGRVLVTGGENGLTGVPLRTGVLASADVYDPATGKFSPTGSMAVARTTQSATLLTSGLVLIAGGQTGTSRVVASAELYDPSTGKFSPIGSMAQVRGRQSAIALADGRVFVLGGVDNSSVSLASAELYDPAIGTFSAAGSLAVGRYSHTATLLSDGSILIVGGVGDSGMVASAELWRP
jgi:WD40 repeat protein